MKLIIIALIIKTVVSWDPVDPEEALFAFSRCMEEFVKQAKKPAEAQANWMSWKLEPADDQATQCYVKCGLVRLGLFDPVAKAFKPERIDQQYSEYRKYDFISEDDVAAYKNALQEVAKPASDSCKDVFSAYQTVHSQHLKTSQILFHGIRENTERIYKELGNKIRQRKQSYFVFCENKYYPEGSADRQKLCRIRAYEIFEDDNAYKQLMVCVFKGLRYFTDENKIDEAEIIRDFQQVGKDKNKIEDLLGKCRANAPAGGSNESVALHYFKCLMTSPLKDDFKEAFDYRELRSEDYALKLKPHKQTYSRSEVEARVAAIDDLQCPS